MANAQIGSYVLDIDPSSASWGYTLNTRTYDTYGGRVVQILSSSIDTLTIGGYLLQPMGRGNGTYDRRFVYMEAFEEKVKQIMLYHAEYKKPVSFRYPALNWEGKVYLKGYSDVKYDVQSSVCSYKLTFDIESGFEGVTIVPDSHGLEVIPSGINWVRNEYNTPSTSWEMVKKGLTRILDAAGTASTVESLGEAIEAALEEEGGEKSSSPTRGSSGMTGDINSNKALFFERNYGMHVNQYIR